MKAIVILLLSLFCLLFSSFGTFASHTNYANPFGDKAIELDDAGEIRALNVTVVKEQVSWSYPYDSYPVIESGQNISGVLQCRALMANARVEVGISELDPSSFLETPKLNASDGDNASHVQLKADSSGICRFTLPGLHCGTYALIAKDANTSSVLSALPLIVAHRGMEVKAPSNITAGDALGINISIPEWENGNIIYAAIIIYKKDYENLRLIINATEDERKNSSNYSNSSIKQGISKMSISLGGSTADLPSGLHSSSIIDLIPIAPENSAIALSEPDNSGAEFYMITDSDWDRGEYILTCLAYVHGHGLVGIKQKSIEVEI
jgi:methanogen extracellular protein (TIGR04279 family)